MERSSLRPLPAERSDVRQWSHARVTIDYHIAFDNDFNSVPYTLVHEAVEVRATPTTVEIFHKGQRVASHLCGRGGGQPITLTEHRPKSSSRYCGQGSIADGILAGVPKPQMGRKPDNCSRIDEHYEPVRQDMFTLLADLRIAA